MAGRITKTDELLYGPGGATDPRNPFRLERDLISPFDWRKRYTEMPKEVQSLVERNEADPWSEGCSVGIGHNTEVGWFILGCGQGPFIIWMENN